ncbi:CxxH/CxxC protein [Thermoactinomyces sp. DSM 45892]|uniref:CxxH/CxxC protein n=1 Tax=Thermoactinomyces sp. DSM 45892 TaxID=1882753 RepID=UPI0008997FF6|nr:CxxH/CxxC protein [Thermoactinomyces sp. DSM 45892]SDY37634.1 CxxH/CxxC protein, BA_5709 family [Thermoactinomyces sp. DSM 45892]
MQDSHIWYACDEHLDYVMDDMIEEFHTAPTLEPLQSSEKHSCRWCKGTAGFQLELEYGIAEQTE